MKIIISNTQPRNAKLGKLKPGEIFIWEGDYYIKTDIIDFNYEIPIVDLKTGSEIAINKEDLVERIPQPILYVEANYQ